MPFITFHFTHPIRLYPPLLLPHFPFHPYPLPPFFLHFVVPPPFSNPYPPPRAHGNKRLPHKDQLKRIYLDALGVPAEDIRRDRGQHAGTVVSWEAGGFYHPCLLLRGLLMKSRAAGTR